jgi:lactate dehydrogenase-like 2-hydroxyacid dehydrogenase
MPDGAADVTILVPGKLHSHSVGRIGEQFRLLTIESADPALLTDEMKRTVQGVASSTRITADFIDALPNLQIIANFGVGYDAVDAAHAGRKGVMVTNTPDVLTEEVADTALGLLINTVRELPKAEAYLRQGRWRGRCPRRLR